MKKINIKLDISSKKQVYIIVLLISIIIVAVGYRFYSAEKKRIINQKEQTLKSIATLKAKSVVDWYNEELRDAGEIAKNPFLHEVIALYKQSPSVSNYNRLVSFLIQFKYNHELADVILSTPDGKVIVSATNKIERLASQEIASINTSAKSGKSVSTDFFRISENGQDKIFISFTSTVELNDITLYSLIFRADPNDFLYPLIESWPIPSQTAESYLFRVVGDSIVFLSNLRHNKFTALSFKLPISNEKYSLRGILDGNANHFTRKDYRGVEVKSYATQLVGTPWFLVSEVDKSELLNELPRTALIVILQISFIVLFAVLAISYLYRTRQKNIFESLYKAEKELWQQNEKFRVTIDSLGDGVIVTDMNSKIQFMNLRAEQLTGWRHREAKGRYLSEVYTVKNEQTGLKENNILEKVIKKGIVKELANHTLLIAKNGDEIPVMDTGAPIYNSNGEITGIVIAFQDETERRQQRRLLVESEARYREFFEADLTGDYIATPDGRILNCNPAFIETLGYTTAEEIIGRNIAEMYQNPDEREKFLNLIQNQKVVSDYKSKLKRKDGTNIVCNENIVGKFDANGNLVQYIGYMYDITNQISAEEELLKKEQLLSSIMETQQELICRFLPDTTLTFVNKAYCNIFEKNEYVLIGSKFLELVPKSEWESILSVLKNINANNPSHTYLSSANKPDGSVMRIEWTDTAILNEQNEVIEFQSTGRDITEKLKAKQELIKAKEKAEESDKLKTSFLQNLSHEIRTPMNGILGFTELLKSSLQDPKVFLQYIEVIELSGNRLMRLITDLIDISKIETGQIYIENVEFNVNNVISELEFFFKNVADEKGLEVRVGKFLPESDCEIVGDNGKLFQILSNLLYNAIKFSEKGVIEFGCEWKGSNIEFYVKDQGIGIPKEKQIAIYKRFVQGDTSISRGYEGAGLGLSICKAYVEKIGGNIWVESEPGVGSTFYFTIPHLMKTHNNKSLTEALSSEKGSGTKSKLKVLIVDDDRISLLLLEKIITEISGEVLLAKNGREAIDICKKNADIDIILMDLKMPQLDGFSATQEIRKFNKDVVIIAQTAYAYPEDQEKALKSGCNDFVTKPLSREVLIKLINDHLK